MSLPIGIDEVGRGPLAGPVTVCALTVRHSMSNSISKSLVGRLKHEFGLDNFDSKKVAKKRRLEIVRVLKTMKKQGEIDFAIRSVSASVIDKLGIVSAINLAITRALKKLTHKQLSVPSAKKGNMQILLDGGLRAPSEYRSQKTIIRGDSTEPIIGLASILAKVHRDKYMTRMHKKYPEYGFDKHVGYGTRAHYRALAKHGPTSLHRLTYL